MNLLEIKHERLSEPERFLDDIFSELVESVSDDDPRMFLYKNDDKLIFKYYTKPQILWFSYKYIRVVFRDKFKINSPDTDHIVQSMVETNLNLKISTIYPLFL